MGKFEEWFNRFKPIVENDLGQFLEKYSTWGYFPLVDTMYRDIHELVFRTGRMGSAIALATYEGISGCQVNADAARIGVALELHGFSILIHDDIYDEDDIRFGKDAYHTLYERRAQEFSLTSIDRERFGRCAAIIAGNILYTLAVTSITSSKLSHDLIIRSVDNLNRACRTTNESQAIDIEFEGTWPTSEDWYQMASRRAAAHTCHCISAGGILADWSDEQRKPLELAAGQLGYCFDIRDDLLDTFFAPDNTLQTRRRDLFKRKKPLHVCLALENAPATDKAELMHYLEKPDDVGNDRVHQLLQQYGFASTVHRFNQHVKQAGILFEQSCLTPEAKEFFHGLLGRCAHTITQIDNIEDPPPDN